jgi:lysophospholipase L1-like esterase
MPLSDIGIKEQIVRPLLHISGGRGLVFDKAAGALTNGSTGAKNIRNYKDIIVPTLSTEIRYKNGIRLENSIPNSESLSSMGTSVTGDGVVGGTGYSTHTITESGRAWRYFDIALIIGHTYEMLLKYSDVSGNIIQPIAITVVAVASLEAAYNPSPVLTGFYSIRFVANESGTARIRYGIGCSGVETGAKSITITGVLLTDISGDSLQSRGYISNGITVYNSGTNKVKYLPNYKYSVLGAIGDSITASTSSYLGQFKQLNVGFDTLNKGISGNTLTQMEARFAADIVANSPEYCVIMGGINDIINAVADPTADMQTKLISMINMAIAANIIPIIINMLPFKTNALWTAERQTWHDSVNSWLLSYAATNNFIFYDAFTALENPSSADTFVAIYDSGDHLHPNGLGHAVIATGLTNLFLTPTVREGLTLPTILHEPATDNLALFPRDFTNAAWVKTNITPAKTATGIDGVANSASTLTATAANATCLQTVTSASSERITGAFIKRRTGTGVINMTQDNGATWTPITVPASWGAEALVIPAATLANPVFGFQIVTSGDAIDVDWVQHELGGYITSPISGSRTEDSIKVPASAAVNFNQDNQITIVKVKMNFANSATDKAIFAANTGATDFIYDNGSGGIALSDGVNTATAAVGGWAAGDTLLIAECHTTADGLMSIHVSKNGGAWADSADTTYDGAFSIGANLLLASANTDSIEFYHVSTNITNMSHSEMVTFAKTNALARAT